MAPRVPLRTQRGLALILSLWVIALMTIMAGSYALSTRREAGLLNHAHERAKAVALADGGVHYAMLMLTVPDPKLRWKADGTPYVWGNDEARVRIRVYDEGGKIDLNAAQQPTLRAAFMLVLGDEERATQLADAILDWRDTDDLKLMHGAESAEYREAGRQPPQNRNFLVLQELQGVLGMTPELYHKLEPWFTLYTGQDGLNPAKAGRDVLLALSGGDQGLVDSYIEQRRLGNPQPFPPTAGVKFHSAGDMAYTVEAQAEFADQRGTGVSAVIKRGRGADGGPFAYLSWRAKSMPPRSGGPESFNQAGAAAP